MANRVTLKQKVSGGGNYFAAPKSKLQFIRSGCRVLDLALGGGWAEGRIANIVGDKSTGKTLLMIEACANFALKHQRGRILYRECEAAFDPEYAAALGMPVDRVEFGEPMETVEELFKDLQAAVKLKVPILYIVDSLDSLSDKSEMERDMEQGSYGANKAKNMSQLFRRLVRQMSSSKLTLLIVSQVRDKIGATYGRKTTRSGGRALDFYASQVLYLQHVGAISKTISNVKRAVGIELKAKCDKNKIALPFREAAFTVKFGFGIDDAASCLEWLKEIKALGLLELSDKNYKDHLRNVTNAPAHEYVQEMQRIHAVVEKRWYELEQQFLPTRRKYGEV